MIVPPAARVEAIVEHNPIVEENPAMTAPVRTVSSLFRSAAPAVAGVARRD
ncbi:hypothetical protein [Mycobacterium marseillense]|uniref:hypothetical protein n=1 Tax=Mycobacterium marseillense TaxID=701042 RepID=UPI000AB79734|nr:hypothetical protein [Mycobacterium marseillense]MCA2264833.1 hypothetical protein [Mycobacterium marseillense]